MAALPEWLNTNHLRGKLVENTKCGNMLPTDCGCVNHSVAGICACHFDDSGCRRLHAHICKCIHEHVPVGGLPCKGGATTWCNILTQIRLPCCFCVSNGVWCVVATKCGNHTSCWPPCKWKPSTSGHILYVHLCACVLVSTCVFVRDGLLNLQHCVCESAAGLRSVVHTTITDNAGKCGCLS